MTKLIEGSVFDYINYDSRVEQGAMFAVPNEIFDDFRKVLGYSYGKCAYAYSYYYLSMYLHLYAKYGSESSVEKYTFQNIQKLLGLSPESRSMNSITKRNGDLDTLGYTCTTTDYPVSLLRLERNTVDKQMEVHHYMRSDERKDFPDKFNHSGNFHVKHPDKMYWRTKESKEDNVVDGTMNQADNTHLVPLEMFLHALNISDIGYKGFYVYAFIIFKDSIRNRRIKGVRKQRGWTIPYDLFSQDIGISDKTLKGILKQLEKYGFITVQRTKGRNGIDLPNTYVPNLNPSKVQKI